MPMVEEISTPHHIEVPRDSSVSAVAKLMRDYEIGEVVVTSEDSGSTVGIVTDRDIAVRVVAEYRDPVTTRAGDICSTEVVTIDTTEEVDSAAKLVRAASEERRKVSGG